MRTPEQLANDQPDNPNAGKASALVQDAALSEAVGKSADPRAQQPDLGSGIGAKPTPPLAGATISSTSISSTLASWSLFVAIAALVLSLLASWWSIERSRKIERVAGEKMLTIEAENKELRSLVKQASDLQRELGARQALTETKLSESLTQQSQLEKQYQELARSRSDLQLADIESSVQAASQQLQWGGNVRTALLALQDADGRLERLNQPPLMGVRRLVTRDIERLRQLQSADPVMLASKIDNMSESLMNWRLLAEPGGRSRTDPRPNKNSEGPFLERMTRASEIGWSALKEELLQLFRVQKLDQPEALLVSPDQAFFVRENLKLRLNSMRLAVLTRNEQTMKTEAKAALQALTVYFDANQASVASAIETLKEVSTSKVSVELPSLAETLNQVRAMRSKETRP
jgi:uroporphyrin-III C-methyltransferase